MTNTAPTPVELVGGSQDGERLMLPADQTFIRFAYLPAVPAFDAPREARVWTRDIEYRDTGRVTNGRRIFAFDGGRE